MVQFIPLVIVPQIFLTGVVVPIEDMPWLLENVSKVLPLTYAVDMLIGIMLEGQGLLDLGVQIIVLSGFGAIFMIGASVTVKK